MFDVLWLKSMDLREINIFDILQSSIKDCILLNILNSFSVYCTYSKMYYI